MNSPAELDALSPDELRTLAAQLMAQAGENARELRYRQTRIDQLTHEIAMLRRQHFGKRSEQLNPEQMSLLNEAIDADLAALETELEQLQSNTAPGKQHQKPKRTPFSPVPDSWATNMVAWRLRRSPLTSNRYRKPPELRPSISGSRSCRAAGRRTSKRSAYELRLPYSIAGSGGANTDV
jgi:Transposase C of IS166 homeodomain